MRGIPYEELPWARSLSRFGYLLAILGLAAVVGSAVGCSSLLFTVAYLFKGTDVDADFSGLEGKRVAGSAARWSPCNIATPGCATSWPRRLPSSWPTR